MVVSNSECEQQQQKNLFLNIFKSESSAFLYF